MGIQEDHETLDTVEAGPWSQLSPEYWDLLPGPASPSRLYNLFGQPPYAFLLSCKLLGLARYPTGLSEEYGGTISLYYET